MTAVISPVLEDNLCVLCSFFKNQRKIHSQLTPLNKLTGSRHICFQQLLVPPLSSLSGKLTAYRRLGGTVSKQSFFSLFFKETKKNAALDESTLELVSRVNAAFKTKAPQAIITVSSIPCQVSDDCPIFSFN